MRKIAMSIAAAPLLAAGLMATGLAGFGLQPASAAGFDCSKATTRTEIAVCESSQLNVLDQRMNYVYRALMKSAGQTAQRDQFRADQRHWIGVRNACGNDKACLIGAVRDRIDALNGYAAALKAGQ